MTVAENVGFGLQVRKLPAADIKRRLGQVLDVVQMRALKGAIRPNCPAASSSAWRWRAPSWSNRRCCCSTSRCPTSTPTCARRCAFEIRRLHDEFKITTVYVTHDQAEAMVTSDRIAVMNKGASSRSTRRISSTAARAAASWPASSAAPTSSTARAGQRRPLRRLHGETVLRASAVQPRTFFSLRPQGIGSPNARRADAGRSTRSQGCLSGRILGLPGPAAGVSAAARFDGPPMHGFRDRQPRLAGDRSRRHGAGGITLRE